MLQTALEPSMDVMTPVPSRDNQVGLLGVVDTDGGKASNEHVSARVNAKGRLEAIRGRFVSINDSETRRTFLGRISGGPFFSDNGSGDIRILIEVQGERTATGTVDTRDRPTPGSPVSLLPHDDVASLLGCSGDMLLGTLAWCDGLPVGLQSKSKDVLPRNMGIFGTVGSGKSNTAQVVIEEAARQGWAVIVLDVEGEYVAMDQPGTTPALAESLAPFHRTPEGVSNFKVLHPASCASERKEREAFTLRLADFETPVVTELIQATLSERNALLDCVEHFLNKVWQRMQTTEAERLKSILDASPQATRPFTLQQLYDRARERSPRTSELFDYLGLSTKLLWLMHSGAFDQANMKSLDPAQMLEAGRVTVIDVSVANDTVKNLATADLLRKVFALKVAQDDAPPTLVVIEEAHSFMSREKVATMQATLQMLRNVTRRGRKRWLATAFVSQQPGHLPAEIFELCNTRLVHTLRSMHNLESLMATTSDITGDLWARCPLLGTGEAILSSPQLNRPAILKVRPASSSRKFTK